MRHMLVKVDDRGDSYFEAVDVAQQLTDFAPPAPAVNASAPQPAAGCLFVTVDHGWTSPPHPAPARQLACILKGTAEVEVTDGSRKQFSAGQVVVVEDTTGKGHITRSVGGEQLTILFVQLTS